MTIRVALIDDNDVFRAALVRALKRFEDLQVVIDVSGFSDLCARLAGERADVVLVDVRMPRMGGAEVIRNLRELHPDVIPMALTVSDRRDDLIELLEAGSRGYVLKTASPQEIAAAIRAVANGQGAIANAMARVLIDEYGRLRSLSPKPSSELGLSEREKMVMAELTLGRTNREIAERLHIAESTVKSHLKSILEKLGARNRLEAVLYASQAGMTHTN